MAIKYEKIKEGDTLWNVRTHKMGNTTMRTVSVYAVNWCQISARPT